MNYLFIINDAPYGNEKSYNALRLAMTLQKEQDASVSMFLLGDGASTPTGDRHASGLFQHRAHGQQDKAKHHEQTCATQRSRREDSHIRLIP